MYTTAFSVDSGPPRFSTLLFSLSFYNTHSATSALFCTSSTGYERQSGERRVMTSTTSKPAPLPLLQFTHNMSPQPDYVLVFSLSSANSPVRSFGDKSEAQVRRLRVEQLKEEYAKLVDRLKAADFEVTSRRGGAPETLLVFVKASEKRVREEVTRERYGRHSYNFSRGPASGKRQCRGLRRVTATWWDQAACETSDANGLLPFLPSSFASSSPL
jgi:hypothetical protein